MNIFVVIPAYNESKTISKVLDEFAGTGYNIIVVDDASEDTTTDTLSTYDIITLKHLINRGQGAALKTGITYAIQLGADIIVTFDADGQHNPSDIVSLINPIIGHDVDVTLGSRFLNKEFSKNVPTIRKSVLKLAVIFTRIFSRLKVTDTHNGLRAFSRRASKLIRIRHDRMAHASEILDEVHTHKLKYKEVPVEVKYSSYSMSKGQSSMAFGKILIRYVLGKVIK